MYKVETRLALSFSFSSSITGSKQATKHQLGQDEKIAELLGTMKDTYSFVEQVKEFPAKIELLEETIIQILGQTMECSFFICEYCGLGFGGMIIALDLLCMDTHENQDN